MNIIILSSNPNDEAVISITKAGKKRGHTMETYNPADLYLFISDKESGYDRIYNGNKDLPEPVRIFTSDIDAVIPRLGANLDYSCAVLEHLTNNMGIFSTQNSTGIKMASNKLISLQKFSQAKLKVPKTLMGDRAVHVKWMIGKVGGLPIIAKGLYGSQGKTVYPLKDEYQSNVFLKNFYTRKENLLLQQFIDANSTDIRAILIDGKVVVAMERKGQKGELRANISQGGSGKKVELSKEDQELCRMAADAVGLKCAGVDIMKDKSGTSYVIEINGNYGYKVETITGVDISTPLIEYCEGNYKNLAHTVACKAEDEQIRLESLELTKMKKVRSMINNLNI
jgi:ribosomal protein S6--L-glutamate ligase